MRWLKAEDVTPGQVPMIVAGTSHFRSLPLLYVHRGTVPLCTSLRNIWKNMTGIDSKHFRPPTCTFNAPIARNSKTFCKFAPVKRFNLN